MAAYTKYTVDQIDLSILSRISESEVEMWMGARLLQIRTSECPEAKAFTLNVTDFSKKLTQSPHYDSYWTLHGAEECVMVAQAAHAGRALNLKITPHATRAAQLRADAASLMAQAEVLEKQETGALPTPSVR